VPLAKHDIDPTIVMPTCPYGYNLVDVHIERNTLVGAGKCHAADAESTEGSARGSS
jgi:hypothetical protein